MELHFKIQIMHQSYTLSESNNLRYLLNIHNKNIRTFNVIFVKFDID